MFGRCAEINPVSARFYLTNWKRPKNCNGEMLIQIVMGLRGNISNKLVTVIIVAQGSTITQHPGFYLAICLLSIYLYPRL